MSKYESPHLATRAKNFASSMWSGIDAVPRIFKTETIRDKAAAIGMVVMSAIGVPAGANTIPNPGAPEAVLLLASAAVAGAWALRDVAMPQQVSAAEAAPPTIEQPAATINGPES